MKAFALRCARLCALATAALIVVAVAAAPQAQAAAETTAVKATSSVLTPAQKKAAARRAAAKRRVARRRAAARRAATEVNRAPTGSFGFSRRHLAAMKVAVKAGPEYFAGRQNNCKYTAAMLADEPGTILAGQFRSSDGGCFVWLNLENAEGLSAEEICKTTLHEMGHLAGLEHATDPTDVMFSPFVSEPVPAPCVGV